MKSAEITKMKVQNLKNNYRFIYNNTIFKVVEEWNDEVKTMSATEAGKKDSKIITFSNPVELLHKSVLIIDGEQVKPSK